MKSCRGFRGLGINQYHLNENNRTAVKEFYHQTLPHSLLLSQSPFFCLSPQQAFNATAVVRHMRKLQLGTSQEGQGQTAGRGELLAPAAGGEKGLCARA